MENVGRAPIEFVYFGNDWFGENRTSSHHIARRLGKRFPLLYVECPGLRAPKATGRDLSKSARKLANMVRLPRAIGEHMWHMTLPQIPFRNLPLVKAFNVWFGRFMIGHAMRRLGIRNPILWFVVPHTADLLGHLGERFVVYYCTDQHSSLPDIDSAEIGRMDDLLTRRANQVFVTSPTLLEPKRALNQTTAYSPHGVDVALFQMAMDPALPVAEGARHLPHPIVGFTGLVESWVDLDLLASLASARPQWTFLIIGRIAVDVSRLKKFTNVIFTGAQPYESLPAWTKAFDVAIIPFCQNELIRNVNPLKLREYLASGRPVVSVPMPEVDRFAGHIGIARAPEEFLAALEDELSRDTEDRRAARIRLVSDMTWEARVEEVITTVFRGLEAAG